MLQKLLALKKRREQGIRKHIAEAKSQLHQQQGKDAALLEEQGVVLLSWAEKRAEKRYMTHQELTLYLSEIQRLQKQHADIGFQLVELKKKIESSKEIISSLQQNLREVINSQEKLNYIISEG